MAETVITMYFLLTGTRSFRKQFFDEGNNISSVKNN